MADVKDEVKTYQWIKGERFGEIVELESSDNEFLYFKGGSRIYKTVAGEFLEEVLNGRVPLPGADQVAKTLSLIDGDSVENSSEVKQSTTEIPSKANSVQESDVTVMGKMIQKMSKKNVVTVPVNINLNIPTPALYSVLSEGMEENDLNEEIMSVAMKQIEINKLQEYIKENVTEFLKEYYS